MSCSEKFAQVSVDLALEQTLNKDTKTKGGIIGISQMPGTVDRWIKTAHYRAAVLSQAKTMVGMENNRTTNHHKEMGSSRLSRDEEDVRKIMGDVALPV